MAESEENSPEKSAREEVVGEFLHGGPRSEEWRLWRDALERRLASLKRERLNLSAGEELDGINEQIHELETQINALATEEVISEFVEAQVDLSLNTMEPEDEYYEYGENGGNGSR